MLCAWTHSQYSFSTKETFHCVSIYLGLTLRPVGSDKLALGASKTMFKPGLSGSLNLRVTFMRLTRFGLLFGTCYGLWSGMSQMGGRNRPCRLRHGSVATRPVEQDGSLTALLPRKQMHFRVGTLHIARSLGTPSMPTPQFGSQGHQLFVT